MYADSIGSNSIRSAIACSSIIKIYILKTQWKIQREIPELPGGELLCAAGAVAEITGAGTISG